MPRHHRIIAALSAATVLLAGAAIAPPALAATAPAAGGPATCVGTPFKAKPSQSVWYRIPAIVRAPVSGDLLAFAEQRDSVLNSSDKGDTSIVLSRSKDRGCTWSAPVVIAEHGTDTVGNPAPVVDAETGTILLLSVDRPQGGTSFHGLHIQRSTDDGVTFTPYADAANDLAPTLRNDTGDKGWSGGLTGPGHAIQLTVGPHAGRIVVPLGYEREGRRGAYAIISDDHGVTWRLGFDSRQKDDRQEGTVAQLPDGRVWISYHEQRSDLPVGTGRIAAVSSDGGQSLSTGFATLKLPTVSVQASALTLSSGPWAGRLLLSSPGGNDPSTRRNMTIFVSRTTVPGSSWIRYPLELEDLPASYSDLVQIDDATVGVLYETGVTTWHEGISFRSVPIAALFAPRTAAKATVASPKQLKRGATANISARVAVRGTTSPMGFVTVTVVKKVKKHEKGFTRSMRLRLIHGGSGWRVASFAGLPKGSYTVRVGYSGTPRIAPATSTTSTLRVK